MESSGRIGIFNNPGTGYENFIAKDVISSGGIFSGPGTEQGFSFIGIGLTWNNC
jgi:hypothetical protein